MCLSCRESKYNKCEDTADLREEFSLEMIQMSLLNMFIISVQDITTLKTAEFLELYEVEG